MGGTECNQSILRQDSSAPVDLWNEKQVLVPRIPRVGLPATGNRHRHSCSKRNEREKVTGPTQFWNLDRQTGKGFKSRAEFSLVLSTTLQACTAALRAILPFYKGNVCWKLRSLISPFPVCRIWGSDSLLSLPPVSRFSSKLAVLLLVWFLRACGTSIYVQRLAPLDERLLHRSCLDNPTSIFGFCLEAEGIYESHPWSPQRVLCEWIFWPFHLPEVVAKACGVTPVTFSFSRSTLSYWISWFWHPLPF